MDEKANNEIIRFYKKRIEPFVAIFILALLITCLFLLYQDNKLKEQIAETCGYETKDYICYCEKNFIDGMKNLQNNLEQRMEGLNVQMDWNNYSESSG